MSLTDAKIRNTKPKERPYKVSDGGGLHLLIKPNGSRLWRLKYRITGKEKLLSIGEYPAVSLKAARSARDLAKEQLASGDDPSELKREARQKTAAFENETFIAVADEYIAKLTREGRAPVTLTKLNWLLDMAKDTFGEQQVSEIKAPTILKLLRRVEDRGTYETARRLRSNIGAVFRYAVATARAETDPTYTLQGALIRPVVQSHAAITDKKALGGLDLPPILGPLISRLCSSSVCHYSAA